MQKIVFHFYLAFCPFFVEWVLEYTGSCLGDEKLYVKIKIFRNVM